MRILFFKFIVLLFSICVIQNGYTQIVTQDIIDLLYEDTQSNCSSGSIVDFQFNSSSNTISIHLQTSEEDEAFLHYYDQHNVFIRRERLENAQNVFDISSLPKGGYTIIVVSNTILCKETIQLE